MQFLRGNNKGNKIKLIDFKTQLVKMYLEKFDETSLEINLTDKACSLHLEDIYDICLAFEAEQIYREFIKSIIKIDLNNQTISNNIIYAKLEDHMELVFEKMEQIVKSSKLISTRSNLKTQDLIRKSLNIKVIRPSSTRNYQVICIYSAKTTTNKENFEFSTKAA